MRTVLFLLLGLMLGGLAALLESQGPPSLAAPQPPQNQPVYKPVDKPVYKTPDKLLANRIVAKPSGNRCEIDAVVIGRGPGTDGERLRFLIDSGADGLYFPMADARRLGFDPSRLSYDHFYEHWGGTTRGATVRLREFRLAGLVLHDVDAAIDETPGGLRLLGMSVMKAWNMRLDAASCVLSW
jgi:clan AA aspartic protease (TIGR02281 family)